MKPLIEQVKSAGVVGAGGAGFPAYAKLDCQVEYVLVNGAECEPLLGKDQFIMQQYTQAMIQGILLTLAHTGARQAIIGIKNKHQDSIEIVQQAIDKLAASQITILVMDDVYPAGDEAELVYEATGRRIPSGGLPKDVGIVVNNVETFVNIYHASHNIPVTQTAITVHGEVREPYTAMVPVGMSYREAIALAGGITCDDYVVIEGGPMMGPVTDDLDKAIRKADSGLIVIRRDSRIAEIKLRDDKDTLRIGKAACDQCSLCTSMCPRNLLGYPIKPHLAMRALQSSSPDNLVGAVDAQACCECNLCTMWACPEGLDPKQVCHLSKGYLRENDQWLTPATLQAKTIEVSPMRDYRKVPTKRLTQRLGLSQYALKKATVRDDITATKRVSILLGQHIGQPAEAIVKVGDKVACGQCIGQAAQNALSVPVHASIAGNIISIDTKQIIIEASA